MPLRDGLRLYDPGRDRDEIVNELTEKGGTVRFAYLLDANSADLVSRNRLEVTVTHVN